MENKNTCLWRQLDVHMFEQDSALAHQACKMVAFLNHKTPDFMIQCCLVLTQWTFFISEPD